MKKGVVYIAGCWDFCHQGHINILIKAKNMGEFLIVGVNSDKFIWSYKNMKMNYDENDRLNTIRKLEYVDVAFILEDYQSQRKYIDIFKPNVIVHGSDWTENRRKGGRNLYEQMNITPAQIEKYGIEFKYPEFTKGISSTILREQLKN